MTKQQETTDNHTDEDIRSAVEVIRHGGVVLYPTDTVWGLGCDARNSQAVKRIYDIKHRSDHKALITLVCDLAMLERTVSGIPEVAYDLIEYSDKPLTIIYDRGIGVAAELMGEDSTLAVRVTNEPFSKKLCKMAGVPLVSTSANISGEPTPATFAEITQDIINAVDYVCVSRRDESTPKQPSTIMRLHEDGTFVVIRK